MAEPLRHWLATSPPLGLSAGPDRAGAELPRAPAAGFGSIELGTVTARAEPGHNPGAAVLLQALRRSERGRCRLGVNIGSQFDTPAAELAADWLAAAELLAPWADFITLNLSAPYYQALLAPRQLEALLRAIERVAHSLAPLPLMLKLPFGRDDSAPPVSAHWLAGLAQAGVGALVVVSGAEATDSSAARDLAHAQRESGLPVVANGGVRDAHGLHARLAAGAVAVQLYTLWAERPAALPGLLAAAHVPRCGTDTAG